MSRLLHAPLEELAQALVCTSTLMRGEVVTSNYTVQQAEDNRDAISKALYGSLFGWIVTQANALLAPSPQVNASALNRGVSEVGILDIFGFENFKHNSFEQVQSNCSY